MYDNFVDLFVIIKIMEKLEKVYVWDVVSVKEYELVCFKLIVQFWILKMVLKDIVLDVEQFVEMYKMDCFVVFNWLLVLGVFVIVEYKSMFLDVGIVFVVVECVQYFIIFMDVLKLNMFVVDQVKNVYKIFSFFNIIFVIVLGVCRFCVGKF